MTLKSYSPKNVSVSGDAELIDTWNSVSVDYDNDRWGMSEATTGELTRTRHEGKLGTITLELPQTTTNNSTLNSMVAEQDAVSIGPIPGTISMTIKDNWGRSLHTIAKATLMKKPTCDFSNDPSDRSWVFKGELDNHKIGGND